MIEAAERMAETVEKPDGLAGAGVSECKAGHEPNQRDEKRTHWRLLDAARRA
jgi:hypothetical protein